MCTINEEDVGFLMNTYYLCSLIIKLDIADESYKLYLHLDTGSR